MLLYHNNSLYIPPSFILRFSIVNVKYRLPPPGGVERYCQNPRCLRMQSSFIAACSVMSVWCVWKNNTLRACDLHEMATNPDANLSANGRNLNKLAAFTSSYASVCHFSAKARLPTCRTRSPWHYSDVVTASAAQRCPQMTGTGLKNPNSYLNESRCSHTFLELCGGYARLATHKWDTL